MLQTRVPGGLGGLVGVVNGLMQGVDLRLQQGPLALDSAAVGMGLGHLAAGVEPPLGLQPLGLGFLGRGRGTGSGRVELLGLGFLLLADAVHRVGDQVGDTVGRRLAAVEGEPAGAEDALGHRQVVGGGGQRGGGTHLGGGVGGCLHVLGHLLGDRLDLAAGDLAQDAQDPLGLGLGLGDLLVGLVDHRGDLVFDLGQRLGFGGCCPGEVVGLLHELLHPVGGLGEALGGGTGLLGKGLGHGGVVGRGGLASETLDLGDLGAQLIALLQRLLEHGLGLGAVDLGGLVFGVVEHLVEALHELVGALDLVPGVLVGCLDAPPRGLGSGLGLLRRRRDASRFVVGDLLAVSLDLGRELARPLGGAHRDRRLLRFVGHLAKLQELGVGLLHPLRGGADRQGRVVGLRALCVVGVDGLGEALPGAADGGQGVARCVEGLGDGTSGFVEGAGLGGSLLHGLRQGLAQGLCLEVFGLGPLQRGVGHGDQAEGLGGLVDLLGAVAGVLGLGEVFVELGRQRLELLEARRDRRYLRPRGGVVAGLVDDAVEPLDEGLHRGEHLTGVAPGALAVGDLLAGEGLGLVEGVDGLRQVEGDALGEGLGGLGVGPRLGGVLLALRHGSRRGCFTSLELRDVDDLEGLALQLRGIVVGGRLQEGLDLAGAHPGALHSVAALIGMGAGLRGGLGGGRPGCFLAAQLGQLALRLVAGLPGAFVSTAGGGLDALGLVAESLEASGEGGEIGQGGEGGELGLDLLHAPLGGLHELQGLGPKGDGAVARHPAGLGEQLVDLLAGLGGDPSDRLAVGLGFGAGLGDGRLLLGDLAGQAHHPVRQRLRLVEGFLGPPGGLAGRHRTRRGPGGGWGGLGGPRGGGGARCRGRGRLDVPLAPLP